MQKRIAILGSTGSIGVQTLNVVRRNHDKYVVEVLCAGHNSTLLIEQALEFQPNAIVIADESKYQEVQQALYNTDIKVFAGASSIIDLMTMQSIDIVVSAIVGFAGLQPTLKAVEQGKVVALVNKETMVVAGQIITEAAEQNNATILPVDSEHSAIFQCLVGDVMGIEKLILTASGGPFRGKKRDELVGITPQQALNHPNWKMGSKVTIDSATLMNKGLEVIEARWLFNIAAENIDVLVHPQSVVHSMVQYVDGSIKAQMGIPSMETPIQYALSFPERTYSPLPRLDLSQYSGLTFEKPDRATFRCLDLAYYAIKKGGNMPCIMNAANENAVNMFLNKELSFLQIADYIEEKMMHTDFITNPTIEDLLETDKIIRNK